MKLFSRSGQGAIAESRLEDYLQSAEHAAVRAAQNVTVIARQLTLLRKALVTGNITQIRRYTEELKASLTASESLMDEALRIDPDEIDDLFRSSAYLHEVESLAGTTGLDGVRATEGRLFSYPYVFEKRRSALSFGTKSLKGVRPSFVASQLSLLRTKATQRNGSRLLEAVERVYDVLIRSQSTAFVRLDDLYNVLTSLPGSERELSLIDLTCTLAELIDEGAATTKSRRRLELPSASTSGRSGNAIRVIGRDGRERLYQSIRFLPTSSPQ